jgi:regulator of RNase E activity RraA
VNRPINDGGVLVRSGDVVLADGDGVIVVPRENAEEVAGFARRFLDNIGKERYEQRLKSTPPVPAK